MRSSDWSSDVCSSDLGRCVVSPRPMRRRRELQENPVLAADKLLLLREAVVLAAEGNGGEARAVGLVGGQALDRVDAVGGGGGALVRREVADEVGDRKSTRLNSSH